MPSGNGRWYWLTILALGNLVLWVAIAVLVGLLVSDQVNLGLETELRQVQATAVAAWKGLSERELAPPVRSTPVASNPRPTPRSSATSPAGQSSGNVQSEVALPTTEDVATREVATEGGASRGTDPEPTSPAATVVAASQPTTAAARATSASRPSPTLSPEPTANEAARDQSAAAAGAGTTQDASPPSMGPTPTLLTQPLLLADPPFQNLAMLRAEMERSAPGRVVQIRYHEAVLSAEIRRLSENSPELPFRNVQTDLLRDQVLLTGEMTVLGFRVQTQVRGTVTARDCRPEIEIQSIAVGGVLTPQYVRDRIEQEVLEAVTFFPADYPLCLEQILLEDTRATILGYHP